MTTARQVISSAYREANITAIGLSPTDNQNAEALDKLNRYIRGVYGYELGEPLSDWQAPQPQRTAPVAANYPQMPYPMAMDPSILPFPLASSRDSLVYPYPPSNSRVVWGGTPLTVYFPEQPSNGARMSVIQGSGAGDSGANGNVLTIDGNGRYLRVVGQTQITEVFSSASGFTPLDFIYISETGVWTIVEDLVLDAALPFPEKYDDLWITALTIRLAPNYNKTIPESTGGTFKMMLEKLKTEYRQPDRTVYGSYEFPRSLMSHVAGRWFYGTIFVALVLQVCLRAVDAG